MSNRRKLRSGSDDENPVPHVRDSEGHNVVILEHPVNGPAVERVCELVLRSFSGPCPPGHRVEHVNGDLGDDNLTNLRYVPVA